MKTKNQSLRVEKAQCRDIPRVIELMRELAEFENLLDEFYVTAELLKQHLFGKHPAAELLVGYMENRICGYALYFYNFSTFEGRPGMYLEDIYVEPNARGCGLGKALFSKVENIAKERGCRRFDWVVLNWNKKAQDFYKSRGAESLDNWSLYRMKISS
jgi:GNAT superfamily N-acetyltransferase